MVDVLSAAEVARGVLRLLADMGFAGVTELHLPNGRRADVAALDQAGRIFLVEIKTSVADFRSDGKWPEYLDHCDLFAFAVPEGFPQDRLPADQGMIVADAFGGVEVRPAPARKMNPSRKRAVTLRIARTAAKRLTAHEDPMGRGTTKANL